MDQRRQVDRAARIVLRHFLSNLLVIDGFRLLVVNVFQRQRDLLLVFVVSNRPFEFLVRDQMLFELPLESRRSSRDEKQIEVFHPVLSRLVDQHSSSSGTSAPAKGDFLR